MSRTQTGAKRWPLWQSKVSAEPGGPFEPALLDKALRPGHVSIKGNGRPTPSLMRHEAEAGTEVKSGMQLKVQMMVNSEQGQSEVIQEVAPLERGALLRPDTLGLSLA